MIVEEEKEEKLEVYKNDIEVQITRNESILPDEYYDAIDFYKSEIVT